MVTYRAYIGYYSLMLSEDNANGPGIICIAETAYHYRQIKLRNQLGHSSIQTTMIYTHLSNEEMRVADK